MSLLLLLVPPFIPDPTGEEIELTVFHDDEVLMETQHSDEVELSLVHNDEISLTVVA